MNTSAVAKVLGVSPSTVQRWVKHLNLQMERNELGHYLFAEEDIELLKQIKEQLHNGAILQDIAINEKKARKGAVKPTVNDEGVEKLLAKVSDLERQLDGKADSVVSYQLLQHRREIEELQDEVKRLHERIEILEAKQSPDDSMFVLDQPKPKKKKIISMLFGF